MKIEDVTNLLANRINQPHYVKDWLEKFYNQGFQDAKKLTFGLLQILLTQNNY
jgi:hypothetical protein